MIRIAVLLLLSAGSVEGFQGGRPATREEILSAVYPGALVQGERIFLTDEEKNEAAALAGAPIQSALVARYRILQDGVPAAYAYVDTHVVRTKKESLLICLDSDGSVRRVEVTAFLEPPEYQASEAWLGQYQERDLDSELELHRGIRPVAGATLTAVAANLAVRRALAIDRALRKRK